MTNLATGKAFTRRDSLKGLAAIFAAGVAPALLGQTARGMMKRISYFRKAKKFIVFAATMLLAFSSAFASSARGMMHRNLGGRIATRATVEKAENKIVVAIPDGATSGLSVTFECDRPASAQVVDWGDGTTTSVSGTSASHTYATSGTYNITWPDALLNVTAKGTCVSRIDWKVPPTFIRLNGFRQCNSLASVGDLSSCTSIGGYAFLYDSIVSELNLSSSCTSIGDGAFNGCTSLASVGDLSSCTSIGSGAFHGCTSLASFVDLSSCTSIGDGAFRGCSRIVSIDFPRVITTIPNDVFSGCTSLTSVGDISATTRIGAGAFTSCSSIVSIGDMPLCTSIGDNAFRYCASLVSIGDLSSCESIGNYEFVGCNKIASLTFSSKTHAEVEAITGFANFPNRGMACVFHCSDGDFYRSGSSLLPMP